MLTPPGVGTLEKVGGVWGGASSPEGLRSPDAEAGGGRSVGVGGAG